MDVAPKLPELMTVEAFLDWEAPTSGLWQLVDGVPPAMAPPSPTHGVIQARIGQLIGAFLDSQSSPCRSVATPGVVPASRSDINMLIPDLAVTCSPIRQEDKALRYPVLVIEILSPGNQAETWINVWACTTIPSVREIVVFRTTPIGALILRRNAEGSWPDQPAEVDRDEVALENIGLCLPIEAVYRTTWLAIGDAARE
jgi:Uma2 family endonuclease